MLSSVHPWTLLNLSKRAMRNDLNETIARHRKINAMLCNDMQRQRKQTIFCRYSGLKLLLIK